MNTAHAEPRSSSASPPSSRLAADTPEIVVDLDVVRANIERVAAHGRARRASRSGRTRRRTSCPQIARLQLEAGAVGVQVAKLGEAEVMADAGIDDILVGYPIVGEQKLARLADLAERAAISVTVDSSEVARGRRPQRLASAGSTIPALLELDTGMHRLGVAARAARGRAGRADRGARRARARAASSPTRATSTRRGATTPRRSGMTLESCRRRGRDGRGDPRARPRRAGRLGRLGRARSASRSAAPGVTEVRPGTYVFNDRSQLAQGAAGRPTSPRSRSRPSSAARRRTASSSTPARRCSRRTGCSSPDPPLSFGADLGPRRLGRRAAERGARRASACRRMREVRDRRPRRDRAEPRLPGDQPRDRRHGGRGRRVLGRWPVAARGHASASELTRLSAARAHAPPGV